MVAIRRLAPIQEQIVCTSRLKKFAYENAYTLFFLVMFFMTWVVIYAVGAWVKGGGVC